MLIHDKNLGVQPIIFLYWASNALVSILMHQEGVFLFSKIAIIQSMESAKTKKGSLGEQVAAKFLRDKGLEIIEMNYRNESGRRLGEIDIIAKENGEWVFVEVKTREYQNYQNTLPEENITSSKLHKLSKIANSYIKSRNLWDHPYHFDAISVWLSQDFKKAKIKHIENIFI